MAKEEEKKGEEEPKKGGKLKLILMILPVILLIAGGAYFFLLKPSGDDGAPKALPEPVAGAVVQLDPITVNLDGGHFLKLGMALQPTKAAGEEVTGAKALDLAIDQFSNMSVGDLSSAKGRAEAKAELVARVKLAYLPEGTSIAAATTDGSKSAVEAEKKKEAEAAKTKEPHGEDSDSESEQTAASMSGAEAIKLAGKLTVQPLVYDVFLTEFVMQ